MNLSETTVVITEPLLERAAWLPENLRTATDLKHQLTTAEISDASHAVDAALRPGRKLEDLSAADFPFQDLRYRFEEWATSVSDDLGVKLISGVPVDDWGEEKTSCFFWGMGLHMGTPGVQNPAGHVLGHVTDTGTDQTDPLVRLYQTSAHINFHCDGLDTVGLLCLSEGKSGGASRIVSSVSVYNEVLRRRPDLAPLLYGPVTMDKRNELGAGAEGWHFVTPCHVHRGRLRTFYHMDYFASVSRHLDAPARSDELIELLTLYESIANDPHFWFDMQLSKGDIQFVSNHTVLHGRTDYKDDPETGLKRHLLRLWLSL